MKKLLAALALLSAAPAFAASYVVDFEKNWDYSTAVNSYYNVNGTASDGTTGPLLGVSFTNVFGLSNDAPGFPFYLNAPSMLGTAYVDASLAPAYMNVASGVLNTMSFFYSSPSAQPGAVKAYSDVNGTGTLLGTLDLSTIDPGGFATESGNYGQWTLATFNYSGLARSFDLSGLSVAGIDNIAYATTIPVPAALPLLVTGLGLIGVAARRRKNTVA
jgi:hypothetical protein